MLTTFVLYFESTMDELRKTENLPVSEKAKLIQGLGDSYSKMVASSKRLLPEVSEMATAIKTVKMFGDFVQANKPELLQEFLELLNGFAETLDKEFK
jgi:hypothetical protein